MSHKKHKIEIASEEEVKQYAGGSETANEPAQPEGNAAGASGQAGGEGAASEPAAEELPKDAQEWKDKCLRAKAELANYQKRVEKERIESVRYANAGLARALLPTIDNLERVIESAQQGPENAASLLEGVKMTLENLLKVLRESSIERIAAEGEAFDPQVHEAMMEQPSEHAERTVLKELMKGYRLHDRVLRPAKVIVSKPAEAGGEVES